MRNQTALVFGIVAAGGIATFIALSYAQDSSTSLPLGWQTYRNVRFSYEVCYPGNVFSALGEAPNADGQKFVSDDGATIYVYGSNNVFDQSTEQAYQEALKAFEHPSSSVTYHVRQLNEFIVSGYKGSKVFYVKTFVSKDQLKTVEVRYDRTTQERYDPLSSAIGACFLNVQR